MAELLVRGGTVIDGTGAPGVVADVRVRDGRISEIGRDLRPHGEDVIDASGALVTPGFIDSHTHYDPSLFWDTFGDPMPLHGVTTLLVGSCSLSLAPVHADQRALLTEVFCYIEDLPTATFDAAIPWTWEGYADYLAALGGGGLGLNVVTLVGHTALRMFVLGDEAWDRPSSPSERSEIASLLDGCLAAGAFGMSTSLGFDVHPTRGPVPSRVADDDELGLLIDCLAERSRLLQFIPSPGNRALRRDVQRVADLTGPTRRCQHVDQHLPRHREPEHRRRAPRLRQLAPGKGSAHLPADLTTHARHESELERRHVVRQARRRVGSLCQRRH